MLKRTFKGRMILLLSLVFLLAFSVLAFAQEYPNKDINIILPTSEGGAIDRMTRAFTSVWRDHLDTNFNLTYHSGAGGEVGYSIFTSQPADGYTLLVGNIGPELIMYYLQKPDYNFPEDYVYFANINVDPAVMWVKKDSPFETIQDLVEEAKKRPLMVSTSRRPHPAVLAALMMAENAGAKFEIIPYGGGSPARTAGLTGEVDVVTTHLDSSLDLSDEIRFLVMFQKENRWKELSQNAPTVKEAFGIEMPSFGASRAFAVHREFVEKYPERFKILVDSIKATINDPKLHESLEAAGLDPRFLNYMGYEETMEEAQQTLEIARKYGGLLTD